jgi:hypothetical protein
LREGERKRKIIKVPPNAKSRPENMNKFQKEREKVERGRKKKKNNKGAP